MQPARFRPRRWIMGAAFAAVIGHCCPSGSAAPAEPDDPSAGWSFSLPGWTDHDPDLPAIGRDGTIYVSFVRLLCALAPDGVEKWRRKIGISHGVAIGRDGTIYVAADGLSAFNPDGTLKWRTHPDKPYHGASAPAIAESGDIYLMMGRSLTAVGADGVVKWEKETGAKRNFAPVIGRDGTIYAAGHKGWKHGKAISRLHAFRPDGTEKWRLEIKAGIWKSPALGDDDTVYFGSYLSGCYSVDTRGNVNWRFPTKGKSVWSTPAVDGGQIYFGAGEYLYAIGADGKLRWRFETKGAVASPAVDKAGNVYCASNDGNVYHLSRTGAVQQVIPVGNITIGEALISEDGTLFVRGTNSLRALPGRTAGPQKGGWPMRRHDPRGTGNAAGEQGGGITE